VPFVQNLKNNDYTEILLNGCSSLPERFAQIDAYLVQKEMEDAKNTREKILPAIRKMIKVPDLTMNISSLFASKAK